VLRRLLRCKAVLNWVCHRPYAMEAFWEPVDEAAYPDYRPTVRRPLCLGTIAERLDEGWYCSEFEFANDMRLVFLNCQLYNEEHSELWALATDLVSPLTNQPI
jgi:hypothetical protein